MPRPDLHRVLERLDAGDASEAVASLEALTQAAPAYAPAWAALAEAYEADARWPEAAQAWQRAAFLVPASPVARQGRARAVEAWLGGEAARPSGLAEKSEPPAAGAAPDAEAADAGFAIEEVVEPEVVEPEAEAPPEAEPGDEASIIDLETTALESEAATPGEDLDGDSDRPRLDDVMRAYLDRRPGDEASGAPAETDSTPDALDALDELDEAAYTAFLRQRMAESAFPAGAEAAPDADAVEAEPPDEEPSPPADPDALEQHDAPEPEAPGQEALVHDLGQARAPEQASPEAEALGATEPAADEQAPVADESSDADADVEGERADGIKTILSQGSFDDLDRLIDELNDARIVPAPDFEDVPAPELEQEIEDVVSETLARIYASQRQYDEAARVYEMLAVQQPDRHDEYMERAREMRGQAPDA